MAKRYIRLNWENRPSTATAMSATNFNIMDKGIDDIDNALDVLESSIIEKIDKSDIIQTDTTNDTAKVPSSAVTYALGQEIDTLNNNLAHKSYVPTADTGTLNTVADANYIKAGKIVIISLDINITTTAAGAFSIGLPVNALSPSVLIAQDHNNKVLYPNVVSGVTFYIYGLSNSTTYRFIIGGSYISAS